MVTLWEISSFCAYLGVKITVELTWIKRFLLGKVLQLVFFLRKLCIFKKNFFFNLRVTWGFFGGGGGVISKSAGGSGEPLFFENICRTLLAETKYRPRIPLRHPHGVFVDGATNAPSGRRDSQRQRFVEEAAERPVQFGCGAVWKIGRVLGHMGAYPTDLIPPLHSIAIKSRLQKPPIWS